MLSILIGLYPIIYFCIDRKFGLLGTKSAELLSQPIWNISFYTHIVFGGFALLVGWIQFSKKARAKNIGLHRLIGKGYVISVLLSGIAGLYIAVHATGGFIASLGFLSLDVVWLYTTISAYLAIRNKDIVSHEKLMIYSYAACFAAVTLRIWLPLLNMTLGDFFIAYKIVAWLCWVPNMVVAYFIVRRG